MRVELTGRQANLTGVRLPARPDDSIARELPSFIGFCCFSAAMQLYDNVALMENADLFNGMLYASLAQLVALAVLAAVGLALDWEPPRWLAVGAALVGAACMALSVSPWGGAFSLPLAVLGGLSLAVLAVCWGALLSRRPPETLCLRVVAGLFVGSAAAFVLFAADIAALSEAVLVALLAASGLPWMLPSENGRAAASGLSEQGEEGGMGSLGEEDLATGEPCFALPATALVTLVVCCLLSAFFSGVTINPYGVQSKYIEAYMHLITTVSFFLLALHCIVAKRVHLQAFVLATLAVLLAGLLMLSTGLTGNVVLPVGLVLAMRGFSWGLGWVVLAGLVCTGRAHAAGLSALCLLAFGGALGRGVGVLLNNGDVVRFTDLGMIGIVSITLLAVAYALMNATKLGQVSVPVGFGLGGRMQEEALPADVDSPEPTADGPTVNQPEPVQVPDFAHQSRLDALDLTEKEMSVAELLLMGMTYQYIADSLGISMSTVRFHVKNIYEKAGVVSKQEFLMKYTDFKS